jgi:hypothetical protein
MEAALSARDDARKGGLVGLGVTESGEEITDLPYEPTKPKQTENYSILCVVLAIVWTPNVENKVEQHGHLLLR